MPEVNLNYLLSTEKLTGNFWLKLLHSPKILKEFFDFG